MKTFFFIAALASLAAPGCNITEEYAATSSFSIYRLRDTAATASDVWDTALESLVLQDTPFLTSDSLTSYRWQTHEFTATASVDSQLSALGRRAGLSRGIPFVAVAGRDRIYLGAFWYSYSSLIPRVPYIDVFADPHRIRKSPDPSVVSDPRNDRRIRDALLSAGILVE